MKMHVDRFTYSEKLEEYLALCLAEDAFSKAFLKNRFLLALADYIIAGHDGNNVAVGCESFDGFY